MTWALRSLCRPSRRTRLLAAGQDRRWYCRGSAGGRPLPVYTQQTPTAACAAGAAAPITGGLGTFGHQQAAQGYIPVHCLPLSFLTASAGYTLDFLPDRLYNNLVIIAPYNGRPQDKKGVFAMKKAEFWKGFGAGFTILLLLMCLCMTAFAASKRTIDVEDGIGLYLQWNYLCPCPRYWRSYGAGCRV